MLRTGLLAAVLALVLAAPAAAWVEQEPALELPAGASCLRAAGPGQLAVLGELGSATSQTDLLSVGDDGPELRDSVTLGWLAHCAEAGGAAGVAPLLAGSVISRQGRTWSRALRTAAPGVRPTVLRAGRRVAFSQVAVGVARGGAAIVAWVEEAPASRGARARPIRLYAAVRPVGARRFGRVQFVDEGVSSWDQKPVVAIDPTGRAHVGWIGVGAPEDPREREDGPVSDPVVRIATAAPRHSFGGPQELGRTWGERIALAAAPDGGALAVAPLRGSTGAWERRPGDRRFAPIRLPLISADEPAVALGAGGGAVLAYRNGGGVDVLRRRPGGAFGRGQEVFPVDEGPRGRGFSLSTTQIGRPTSPPDPFGGALAVRLAADGAIVVAWVDAADAQGTTEAASAHAVHGTLAGGFPQPAARLGSACRAANATAPFELADGRLAVAWTDNASGTTVNGEELVEGAGQVHVARPEPAPVAPLAPAPPAPPAVEAELVERSVKVGDPLHVRVRCDGGPCDVRAVSHAERVDALFGLNLVTDPESVTRSTTLAAGAVGELELEPPRGHSFARPGTTAPVRIALTVCPPAGATARHVTLEQPLAVAQVTPLPRILELRARQLPGGAVRVTWRSARPAGKGTGFMVFDADSSGRGPIAGANVPGRGRTRFAVTLRPRDKPIRRVSAVLYTSLSATADFADARVRRADGG